jgi:hypothetical protein
VLLCCWGVCCWGARLQDDNIPIVAQFMPGKTLSQDEAEKIAQMGNSPTFVSMDQMRKLVPIWQDLSVQIFKNQASNKVLRG